MDTPYRKNLPDMYERLRPFQDAAIRNSEKLAAKYEISNPGMDNPSTSVHKLVKEIIKASK
jgi:hypothetical protein